MQQREKLLAVGLMAIIGLWFGSSWYTETFLKPVQLRAAERDTLDSKYDQLEEREYQLMADQQKLVEWREASLPSEPLDAQRVYQQWITDLAQLAGFRDLKVTPERRDARPPTYTAVQVGVDARARTSELSAFLQMFYDTKLLHQITALTIDSPYNDGDPLLEISLTAEGLAMTNANDRKQLFPRGIVDEDIDTESTTLPVMDPRDFTMDAPFRVRLDQEVMQVDSAGGNVWSVQRGQSGTSAVAHPAGSEVELWPEAEAGANTVASSAQINRVKLFVKPSPPIDYHPHIEPLGLMTAYRGQTFEQQVQLDGWDSAAGDVTYNLAGDVPDGFAIDASNGKISWAVPSDAPLEDMFVSIAAASVTQPAETDIVDAIVTVAEPNQPPQIAQIDRQIAYTGRAFDLRVQADDPDGSTDQLTYSIEGDAPDGLSIEADTGRLSWTPPESSEPGDVTVTVRVTDHGTPPESATVNFPLTIDEDAAMFTYLVGIVREGDDKRAWFYDRAADRKTEVSIGEEVFVADVRATVEEIDRDHITLKRGDQLLRMEAGENLRSLDQKP